MQLGAEACDKVKKGVTQLIFSNGHEGNFAHAKKLGVPILSMGWLEEAKNTGLKPDESAWPSFSIQRYNSPHLFPKLKKMRSMQPKTLEEDYAKATKSMAKKLKVAQKKAEEEAEKKRRDDEARTYVPKDPYYYKGCNDHKKKPHYLDELLAQASPSGQVSGSSTPSRSTSAASSDDDFDTPLAQRLLKHRLQGVKEVPSSPSIKSPSKSNLNSPSSNMKLAEEQSSNLDTTGKMPVKALVPSPSPSRRSARASTQLCSKATEQAVLQDASPPFQELPPSPVLKNKGKTRNPLGAPVLESTRLPGGGNVKARGRTRSRPLGKPIVESTRLSFSPKKVPQVSPIVQKIQNDILFDSLLKSPPKQAVTVSTKPLQPPSTSTSSAIKPLPLPKPSTAVAGEVERRVSALTAPRSKPGATLRAVNKSLRRPPSTAPSTTVKPSLSSKGPVTASSPSKTTPKPSKATQQSPLKAGSPGKSPRLIAPWRHQGKAPEPEDYEDVYEFSTVPDEPTTSSRPAKPPGGRSRPPLQSPSRRELPSSSKSQSPGLSQSPRRSFQELSSNHEALESSSTHGSPRRSGTNAISPTRPFSASSTSPSRLPLSASSSSPSRPLTSPPHPLASPPASLSPSRKESAVSSPTQHRIASPATNRLGSPSARIGSPRAEHSRLTTGSSQRPGSLLLPSSATPGISLTSLASDNIVASVESLNEEENNRPPPALSSTSQAAWKSLASTSLVAEPPSKPKKSALLSRIFSKPPTPKAAEASKTVGGPTDGESNEGEAAPAEEQEVSQANNVAEEDVAGKSLPKRAHKLLPQRTQAVLDQTVDPKNNDCIEDAKSAEVTNVHLTAKAKKREAVDAKVAVGEKEKAKKGKKRKEVEKKVVEEEVSDDRIQKELRKRRKAAGSRRSSADFVKPQRSQSRQVNHHDLS